MELIWKSQKAHILEIQQICADINDREGFTIIEHDVNQVEIRKFEARRYKNKKYMDVRFYNRKHFDTMQEAKDWCNKVWEAYRIIEEYE